MIVLIEGAFKQRYNSDQYEFKLVKITFTGNSKTTLTKQVDHRSAATIHQ